MSLTLPFIRTFFVLLSVLWLTAYTTTTLHGGYTIVNVLVGVIAGLAWGLVLISLEILFKRFSLRAFNTAILGLFLGYLMGEAIMLVFSSLMSANALSLTPEVLTTIKTVIFSLSVYLGMVLIATSSEDMYVSIPFVKFKTLNHAKKDILIEGSILTDSRLIDLATSGLLDRSLVLPRFILKELNILAESSDEALKQKARRSLDVIKKLEEVPHLEMRYVETDFPDVKDSMTKLTRIAKILDANIMTADMNRIQQSSMEGLRIINIHTLSNALKPITHNGEFIMIKIQRYGKEAKQGVGYLEDGTMVVVNGGADFLGETIKAQVLSVKHTASGRLIFCNAVDAELPLGGYQEFAGSLTGHGDDAAAHKSYFAL